MKVFDPREYMATKKSSTNIRTVGAGGQGHCEDCNAIVDTDTSYVVELSPEDIPQKQVGADHQVIKPRPKLLCIHCMRDYKRKDEIDDIAGQINEY